MYNPEDPAGFSITSNDPETKGRMLDYWGARSRGYNLTTLLELHDTEKYEHLINSLVPKGRRARVCDMGTSCGFMAIVASRMGHDVVGIDKQPKMIQYAKANARRFNLDIDFRVGDAETLDLGKDEFDLIIAKNTIWCLSEPVAAIRRWVDSLRPGGHMLVMDGNYYLGNFEPDYAEKMHLGDLRNSETRSIHGRTNMDHVDFMEIRDIAKDLPACRMRRPGWDVSVLMGLGMDNIYLNRDENDPYVRMTDTGYMILPGKFVVSARKPPAGSDPLKYLEPETRRKLSEKDELDARAATFKALADPNRIMILQLLLRYRMNVKSISEITGMSSALVSHNLKILASAGIVTSSRNGKEVFYLVRDHTKLEEMLYYSSM